MNREPPMRLRYKELWKTEETPECRRAAEKRRRQSMRFHRLCQHRSPVQGAPEPTRIRSFGTWNPAKAVRLL